MVPLIMSILNQTRGVLREWFQFDCVSVSFHIAHRFII